MTVANCLFTGNVSDSGGGAIVNDTDGSLTMVDCRLVGNRAYDGGAVELEGSHTTTFERCEFSDNESLGGGGGGAVCTTGDIISATFIDCVFAFNTATDDHGGALSLSKSDFSVIRCEFIGNTAGGGGAVSFSSGTLIVLESTFSGNSADEFSAGALSVGSDGSANLQACTFSGNTAEYAGGAVDFSGTSLVAEDCVFELNDAAAYAGAVNCGGDEVTLRHCDFIANSAAQGGGAIYSGADQAVYQECTFARNKSKYGGGLLSNDDALVIGCTFVGNETYAYGGGGLMAYYSAEPLLMNCLFIGNRATVASGGAVASIIDSHPLLLNCTLVGNSAELRGGGLSVGWPFPVHTLDYVGPSQATVSNSIFWDNVDQNGQLESSQIFALQVPGNTVSVDYSCIEGLTGALGGEGNIGDDPLFVDPDGPDGVPGTEDDDLRLGVGSPCIDAADNTALPVCIDIDLDVNLRRVDDPRTRDTGFGRAPLVDMGAFEFASFAAVVDDCNGNGLDDGCEFDLGFVLDCNGNGVPDSCDLADGVSPDCNGNGIPDECDIAGGVSVDCNDNGIPDACDFDAGAATDCNGNGIPDACDIAGGFSSDCDENDVPDECGATLTFHSGALGPVGYGLDLEFVIPDAPLAAGPVTFTFIARADLNDWDENVQIRINDDYSGLTLREGNLCNRITTGVHVLSAEYYNEKLTGGDAIITLIPSEDVDINCDPDSFIAVTVEYPNLDSVDCDRNGVFDVCEGLDDCDGDGRADICDLDCNGNGVSDVCELLTGAANDCNGNGVPDECDIAAGVSPDCNRNGVPDECDTDCDDNGVPDDCEIVGLVFLGDSGELSPFDGENPQSFTIVSPSVALSDVTLTFDTDADLNDEGEHVDIELNGIHLGTFFEGHLDEIDCQERSAELVFTADEFNLLIDGGDADFEFTPTEDIAFCGLHSFIAVRMEYDADPDANGNGLPDVCEHLLGDLNGDTVIDAADLIILLGAWGVCDDCRNCPADLNDDCVVDPSDLLILLGNWG